MDCINWRFMWVCWTPYTNDLADASSVGPSSERQTTEFTNQSRVVILLKNSFLFCSVSWNEHMHQVIQKDSYLQKLKLHRTQQQTLQVECYVILHQSEYTNKSRGHDNRQHECKYIDEIPVLPVRTKKERAQIQQESLKREVIREETYHLLLFFVVVFAAILSAASELDRQS